MGFFVLLFSMFKRVRVKPDVNKTYPLIVFSVGVQVSLDVRTVHLDCFLYSSGMLQYHSHTTQGKFTGYTYMGFCGHPVNNVFKLATSQSAVSQQQPMSQKLGVKSQRQSERQYSC